MSSTYYADLSLTGTGGTGTQQDPWHAETFQIQAFQVLPAGDIVKISNCHDWSGPLPPNTEFEVVGSNTVIKK